MKLFSYSSMQIIFFLIALCEGARPPLITPNVEALTIREGNGFNLTCTGDKQLTVKHNGIIVKKSQNVTSIEHAVEMNRSHIILLSIFSVRLTDAGNYTCYYVDDSDNMNDSIFVSVEATNFIEAAWRYFSTGGMPLFKATVLIALYLVLVILLLVVIFLVAGVARDKYRLNKVHVALNEIYRREEEEGTLQKLNKEMEGILPNEDKQEEVAPQKLKKFPLAGHKFIIVNKLIGKFKSRW